MSIQLTLDLPDGVFSALRQDREGLIHELKLAAAVKWYEMGLVSQEKAAEIAGLSRHDFIFNLARSDVSAVQYSVDEVRTENPSA